MLLSECVNSLEYPLAWSRAGRYTATFVLVIIAAVGLLLHPYSELVVIIWLGVWRCYVMWQHELIRLDQTRLRLNSHGHIVVNRSEHAVRESCSSLRLNNNEVGYHVRTVVGFPGFGWLCLQSKCGKRLEILIFYRYHLRHSYWRLMRHVHQQSALQNYDQLR